jgi:hypothetical protein
MDPSPIYSELIKEIYGRTEKSTAFPTAPTSPPEPQYDAEPTSPIPIVFARTKDGCDPA